MPKLLSIAIFLAASPAFAGTLYKCMDAKGAATVQNDACPEGSTTAWVRGYTPEPYKPPTPKVSRSFARSAQVTPYAPVRIRSGPTLAERAAQACAQARASEQSYRDSRGLKITYDDIRRITDKTWNACKHAN